MDFFEAQERARKRTSRLVILFALAVIGTILAGYFSAVLLLNQGSQFNGRHGRSYSYYSDDYQTARSSWWNPQLLLWITGGTATVVGLASLYKWSQMRGGGSAVAEMVGARVVDPKTTDLRERKLLNVVEEMSIASGIPMPAVYVLENEAGLNAFAAGLTTSDAAVTVTRGTLDRLTRDELQGVIGHEFSHILNGDMRLNVRITAVIFGILVIGLLGRGILQSMAGGRVRSSSKKDNNVAVLLGIGLALMVVGYVGYFFGRLIQAAVSRQREFLADASAVQFTRNPAGITGALKKIGGYAIGSTVANHESAQIGHFFFAQAFKSNFGGLWATHPSLDERIRAIEPTWDGKLFEPEEVVDVSNDSFATSGFNSGAGRAPEPAAPGIQAEPPVLPPQKATVPVPFKPRQIVASVGALTEAHFRQAQSLLESIPDNLREAARDPTTAQVLVYGLLFNGDKAAQDQQLQLVEKNIGTAGATTLATMRPALNLLDPEARLPLLQLSFPALRGLTGSALDRFVTTLDELVHADGKITPFEYAVQKMLTRQLQLAQKPSQRVEFDSFSAVRNEFAVVLSALANLSPKNSADAFADGAAQIPVIRDEIALLDATASGLEQLDAALDKLALCSMPIKQRLLVAAGSVIASDGTVSEEEGELYRALAATVDCPMPNLGLAA
ncbi:MAG TPA: M48 family metallopeptidase [Lacunisphaera sp.]